LETEERRLRTPTPPLQILSVKVRRYLPAITYAGEDILL
jgi:hypothetical protein